MNHSTRMAGLAMALAVLMGCRPDAPEPAAQTSPEWEPLPPAPAPAPAPPPPVAAVDPLVAPVPGTVLAYICDQGPGVSVTYDEHGALVKLPGGSTMLPRVAEASQPGNDAYLGEELSLYRSGDSIRLDVAGRTRICRPPGG